MNPIIATVICACGIAGLFHLNRDRAIRTSKALWIPVVYFWIMGSRSVSEWLNINHPGDADSQLEGSPVDAAVFGILILIALAVLFRRKQRALTLLRSNLPILLYFFFCLISTTWSVHPDVAFKRWVKSIIDIAMVLVIVTDTQPVAALKRFISRTGFILLPLSVLFIKYMPNLGRSFAANGVGMNTGTSTNKNVFGLVILVISLGTLWQIISLIRTKTRAERRRPLIAQFVLLLFGLVLFRMADSATSLACFLIGGSILVATNLRMFRTRPGWIQALCLGVVSLFVVFFLISGSADIAGALGRQSNLSGRTDIWAALLPTVPNPLIGAGFESYWIGPSPAIAWATLSHAGWWHPELLVTEAHNGYIEMYLNLGWAGIGLIAIVIVAGFLRAMAAVRRNAWAGSLPLAYIMAAVFYDLTEAGFRSLNPMWMFLLLGIFTATGVKAGMVSQPVSRRRAGAVAPSSVAIPAYATADSIEEKERRIRDGAVQSHWSSGAAGGYRGKGGF